MQMNRHTRTGERGQLLRIHQRINIIRCNIETAQFVMLALSYCQHLRLLLPLRSTYSCAHPRHSFSAPNAKCQFEGLSVTALGAREPGHQPQSLPQGTGPIAHKPNGARQLPTGAINDFVYSPNVILPNLPLLLVCQLKRMELSSDRLPGNKLLLDLNRKLLH